MLTKQETSSKDAGSTTLRALVIQCSEPECTEASLELYGSPLINEFKKHLHLYHGIELEDSFIDTLNVKIECLRKIKASYNDLFIHVPWEDIMINRKL